MDDTPDYVKKIQLDIWLAKSFEERLLLTLKMNDELSLFWSEVKKSMARDYPPIQPKPADNQ